VEVQKTQERGAIFRFPACISKQCLAIAFD